MNASVGMISKIDGDIDANTADLRINGDTTISGDDLTIGNLSAFSGSFTQRSAIDVVAHSDGDLLTAYASGSSGDRFNIELDTGNSLAKISNLLLFSVPKIIVETLIMMQQS